MDVSQYLGIFLDEAREHIQVLSDQMMTLEQEPENQDAINEISSINSKIFQMLHLSLFHLVIELISISSTIIKFQILFLFQHQARYVDIQ